MRSYTQFTQEDRIMLSMLINKGFKQVEIAREINKSQSAISRELNRNKENINSSCATYFSIIFSTIKEFC